MPKTSRQAFGWAYSLGFGSALATTLGGIAYFLAILVALLSGQLTFPPSESLQLFGGISSLLFCPALVVLFACLHTVAPLEKKAFSQTSLGFCLLFALSVSINRFTQLGVVRQSFASGTAQGLAFLFAVPLFSNPWLRGLSLLYAVLGITSAVAFLLASPLSVVGFVAWGLVLFMITAMLGFHFRKAQQEVAYE